MPTALQDGGVQNTNPGTRWSTFPASGCNIPFSGCDYVWTIGTASPYDIVYDIEDDPSQQVDTPTPGDISWGRNTNIMHIIYRGIAQDAGSGADIGRTIVFMSLECRIEPVLAFSRENIFQGEYSPA